MLDIYDLFDLTSIWFYAPIISAALFTLIGIFIVSKIYHNKSDETFNILYYAILGLIYLIDLIVFIVSIRKCPHLFISYFFSIYLPLSLFFITIIGAIFSIIKLCKISKWSIETIIDFTPNTFYIITVKICFGLAYGSISSIIWILFDYLTTLGKTMTISQNFELPYDKKID